MSFEIRLPNINSSTADGQLAQIRTYMYQLVEQMNYALNNLHKENSQILSSINADTSSIKEEKKESASINNFNEIKSLIIKSSDIINAYYDVISKRLNGSYISESEFGAFKQETTAELKATSEYIDENFYNKQSIDSELTDIREILSDSYIRRGVLGYNSDGSPIYGVEIGQKITVDGAEKFDKFARFTSDRLSFFDKNDIEVAYISDYKLHITKAEISGSVTLGRYLIDTSDGLAFKWV